MAQSGRMSKVHDAHTDSMYSPMSAKAEEWGRKEPPREMDAINPTLAHGKHPSPGLAQGRWSHQPGESEQGTPLRNSFQQEVVGPGTGQVQDPNLHDQYFGVDTDVNDFPGADDGQQEPYYHDEQRGQLHMQDYERGRFV